MVYGIIQVRKIHSAEWVSFVQIRADKAQSVERRFTRWVHNKCIDVACIYWPSDRRDTGWKESKRYLAFDTRMLWNSFCQLRLSVIYRGRAIPLVWETIEHASRMVSLDQYKHLLQRAKARLPKGIKIVFLADRAFADTQLMDYLSNELHWNWRFRYKKSVHLYRQSRRGQKRCRLNVSVPYAHANFYHNIYLTEEQYGPVHVAFVRLRGASTPDPEPVAPSKSYRPPNSIVDEFEICCYVFHVG